ncbi:MAG: dTDP-glucose 4,6-dehydratase [Thermodesulfobacteriota bacterium]|nr:dTDP-glucose 4,6-dehydratase [Thermodesulfobacteriota bacterium]
MKILVTGGAGFIGSNFIRYMLQTHPLYEIINLDKLTYSGNLENLTDVSCQDRYRFVKGDICDVQLIDGFAKDRVDVIVNFAAESHVDRSIMDSGIFISTNVLGTHTLLEAAYRQGVKKFIQVSTDEVYGSLGPDGYFTEKTPLAPKSPYSASKASADLLVKAFHHTHGLPTIITRCSNNYGPYQFPEKLIPLFVTNALADIPLPLYGDGLNVRDWLYVEDHCSAIDLVVEKGREGEVYNIGGNCEKTNLEITRTILRFLGKPEGLIKYVKDRLGHDRRYAINSTKIQRELGWSPRVGFEEGIEKTIKWYTENTSWWEKIKSREYQEYYSTMYENR